MFAICFLVDPMVYVCLLFSVRLLDLSLTLVFWWITLLMFGFCSRKKLKSFSCLFLLLNPFSKSSHKGSSCILVRIYATHGTFWILWLWSRGKSQFCCYLKFQRSIHVTIFAHTHITIFVSLIALRTCVLLMFQFVLIAILMFI